MRIDWLNTERTEAVITRGFWRWKKRAEVVLFEPKGKRATWYYTRSRIKVPEWLACDLDEAQDWDSVEAPPEARALPP